MTASGGSGAARTGVDRMGVPTLAPPGASPAERAWASEAVLAAVLGAPTVADLQAAYAACGALVPTPEQLRRDQVVADDQRGAGAIVVHGAAGTAGRSSTARSW